MDFTKFYAQTSENLSKASEYLKAHGIPMNIAEALRLGYYDPTTMAEAKAALESAGVKDPTQGPTLIVPFDEAPFWAGIDMETQKKAIPKVAQEIMEQAILGWQEFSELERPIWRVENIPDLLALKAVGASAVYTECVGGPKLERQLREHSNGKAVIFAPPTSADDAAWKDLEGKADDYRAKSIPATVPDPEQVPEGWKGAAAMLMTAPEALKGFVESTEGTVIEGRMWERQVYRSQCAGDEPLTRFWDVRLAASVMDAIPTGLSELDKMLDGGLYPGLYVLGAMSSVGKTSLTLQIADTISANGTDVLFFTAEQSRDELIAKSLSRIMGELVQYEGMSTHMSARNILRGGWKGMDRATLEEATQRYRERARNLWIIENDEERGDVHNVRIGLDTIQRIVRGHIDLMGTHPVVFIDYLQIVQSIDDVDPKFKSNKSDKQRMDEMVSELRRLSKSAQVPIVAVSSLNRQSYNAAIEMSAFKESGAIEYGADVILALQPRNLNRDGTEKANGDNKQAYHDAMNSAQRQLELSILKNRMGMIGSVNMVLTAKYGMFKTEPKEKKQ